MIEEISKISAFIKGYNKTVGLSVSGLEVDINNTEEVLDILVDKLNRLIRVVNKLGDEK